jgi:hypothetical protein
MYIIALIEIVFGCLERDAWYLGLAVIDILIAKEMKEGK